MTGVTRWWWIRHAPTVNPDALVYGQLDLAADTGDRRAVAALAARLPREAVWLTTPLRRTGETATALGGGGMPAPAAVDAFMEQHFGAWQGRPQAEVYGALGADHPFWRDPAGTGPPGGESFADLVGRVVPAIAALSAAHDGRDIVAVAHAGTIRAALAAALGLSPARALSIVIDPLSLTRIDRVPPAEWRIVGVNLPP